ncbi:hypothetical protein PACTADRAFT_49141 [Pachysolen tannophilus NRRL Y-2460]|uniref:Actin-related protein 2/3 complex subunit n=1 Tax=Pachysolen tannophilus NRRL Y-2460 TaxID=669874 RepID=A0A1E4U0H7_PACTA|nr:hypothetical protein PACTADRAFT_49141 [Pachysolen tannophilus NRRL Y-2460]
MPIPNPIPFQLTKEPIYDHCFSGDRKFVAITKQNTAEIYDLSNNKPKLVTVLEGHDKTITAIDIAPDGKIVTCSQDRNAIVWNKISGTGASATYKSTLVLLRINRAATVARWSPNGLKFAVGSSDRIIAVCYFEPENDWWVSKHIKKPLKSTILSLDWHENNVLLSCGSADGHVRVFSGFIKSVDEKPAPTVWGDRLPFQTLCGDYFLNGSWIHDVKFSTNGEFLAFVSHDSSINILYPSKNGQEISIPDKFYQVKTSFLPFKSLIFINNSKIITAGNDCYPVVFEGNENSGWNFTTSIDDPIAKKQPTKVITNEDDEELNQRDALNMFRQMDLKGSSSQEHSGLLPTIHQNSITKIRPYSYNGQNVAKISTSGNDGKIVIFDV